MPDEGLAAHVEELLDFPGREHAVVDTNIIDPALQMICVLSSGDIQVAGIF
jgi:hypothetical protein